MFRNGFQLNVVNCAVHFHSLPQSRRPAGGDRDSSLTSGRKGRPERRSGRNAQNAAVVENLASYRPSYSTSRKDQRKRPRDDEEE